MLPTTHSSVRHSICKPFRYIRINSIPFHTVLTISNLSPFLAFCCCCNVHVLP
ncbi:hypothetical protein BDZ94DRAFT_1275095 [Collybia nuda]|uniref:Uncharacterized protein n=1 Tax=Collybia nuda TaxID=64659 RepID=A0A9P5XTP0_9AGAR|nr:hypothetical protein BDZ94DRAFT_1275095 [Collybia nuda]